MTTTTARAIIEEARTQDARFFDLEVPDGALLLGLNTTHRRLLLEYADAIEGLVDGSQQVAAQVSGALVGVDSHGDPYYITTSGDGYPVLNAGTVSDPVPYVDFSGVPVALDPFGETGSTPGFPLPTDLLKLIMVVASYADGEVCDVDVIRERSRNNTNTHNPTAFVNGNRLVPVRNFGVLATGGWPDLWSSVTAVTVSYLGVPTLSALTDLLTVPTVLHTALVAACAAQLATSCPSAGAAAMSSAERQSFATRAADAAALMRLAGTDILGELEQNSIIYHT